MNRSFLIGLSVFITIMVLTQFLAFQQYRIIQIEQTKELDEELSAVRDRVIKTLNYSFSATKTLGFIIEQYGIPDDFQRIAEGILSSYEYIDALELTRKGVITHVYPIEGNESSLGLDVLSYPSSRAEAKKAIEKDELFFAGPLELVQGGMGIVGRLPIYKNNEFFGFSVVLIKLPTFLKSIGISNSESREFNYQLSKLDPNSKKEVYFLSDVIDKENDVVSSIEIADGEWKLYVSPKSNLNMYQQPIGTSILGLLLAGLSGLFFYQWSRQPEKLNRLVEEKTSALRDEKFLSDSIINSLPGVFYLLDKGGNFIRWNRYLEIISGFSNEEMRSKSPFNFFKVDHTDQVSRSIATVFSSGEGEMETMLVKKNGEKVPYYLYGRKINLEDTEFLIGMGIDISEQRQAQENALIASRDRETTLNRISDGVISLDKDWNYKFINDAASIDFPNGREKAIGKNILEIHPDLIHSRFWEVTNQAVENMTVREVESYFQPLDKWFAVKIYPSKDGVTVFYRDVTDVKKAEKKTLKMIGRELHDNVIQVLTGAGIYLNLSKRNEKEPNRELNKADELIKKCIEEIRMLSHDLVSPFSNGRTLKDGIKEVFEYSTDASGILVQLDFNDIQEELLSDRLKTTIFRIVQEQSNNIFKYGQANKVILNGLMETDQIIIKIKDDGVGFDPDIKSSGIGFINIRSRVSLFNGKFEIDSSPGNGCEIRVTFPFPEQVTV